MSTPRFVSPTATANIEKILAHLVKSGTATQRELAVVMGMSKDYTGDYLRHMLSARLIHVAAPQNRMQGGSCPILWGAGASADDDSTDTAPRNVRIEPARQLGMRRDPLALPVAFFQGATA